MADNLKEIFEEAGEFQLIRELSLKRTLKLL